MRKIICDNEEHVLLTVKEFESMIGTKLPVPITLQREPVEVQMPLKISNCANWYDPGNWANHCGIVYKHQSLQYNMLYRLRTLLMDPSSLFGPFFTCTAEFDGKPINLTELCNILTFMEERKPTNSRTKDAVYTHYPSSK